MALSSIVRSKSLWRIKGDTVFNDAGVLGVRHESMALEFVHGNSKSQRVMQGPAGSCRGVAVSPGEGSTMISPQHMQSW